MESSNTLNKPTSGFDDNGIDDVCWDNLDIRRYLLFNMAFTIMHDSIMHPLELLIARQQHYSGSKVSLGATANARFILQREGIRGLFRGLIPSTLGNVPGQLIYFGVYERLKQALVDTSGTSTISKAAIGLVAGFVADVVSLAAYTPAEVISVRLMVSTANLDYGRGAVPPSPVPTARKILFDVWQKGGLPGLYRGLVASIMCHGPASAAWFCTYELVKGVVHDEQHCPPTIPVYLTAGGMAGVASVLVSNPMDVAKVRLQTSDLSRKPTGFWNILLQVVRNEGLSGMAKGIGPRLFIAVPGSALTFTCYEIAKRLSLKHPDSLLDT